jgi:hypothetical protein
MGTQSSAFAAVPGAVLLGGVADVEEDPVQAC